MSARVAGAALVLAWLALWQHAEAQTGKAHRIGALGESPPTTPVFAPLWQGFLAGLHDYGWSEGRNLVIETRFAGDRPESVSDMAAELVAGNVELIVAFGSQATEAARARTRTIPIVTVHASHPVAAGFAASLAKPGGNLTGISNPLEELMAKHLELLKELRPETERVAVLYNPEGRSSYFVAVDATSAAPKLDLAVMPLAVIEPRDLDSAFAAARQAEAQGLVVYPSPLVGAPPTSSIASCAAPSRAICRSSSRPGSSW
jgi:putative ABC transport system substrate-binding protein